MNKKSLAGCMLTVILLASTTRLLLCKGTGWPFVINLQLTNHTGTIVGVRLGFEYQGFREVEKINNIHDNTTASMNTFTYVDGMHERNSRRCAQLWIRDESNPQQPANWQEVKTKTTLCSTTGTPVPYTVTITRNENGDFTAE